MCTPVPIDSPIHIPTPPPAHTHTHTHTPARTHTHRDQKAVMVHQELRVRVVCLDSRVNLDNQVPLERMEKRDAQDLGDSPDYLDLMEIGYGTVYS